MAEEPTPVKPDPSPATPPAATGAGKAYERKPRLVQCAKLGQELPGLATPPFPTALGERIFACISQQAWSQWLQHSQRLINERGLNLADPQARAAWLRECETFLFGGGTPPPPGWAPPAGFVRLELKKGRSG